VKVSLFEQIPYRYLPDGFAEHYSSVVTTPYHERVEPRVDPETQRPVMHKDRGLGERPVLLADLK